MPSSPIRRRISKSTIPKEFLAGVLNNRIDKIDEIAKYVVYMKEKNIAVYPPDVNKSRAYFSVQGDGLRFGLCALRGVGIGAMEKVIEEREAHGPFKDFPDFIMRCVRFVNKKMVESLIFGGAFDSMGKRRAQYHAVYEELMRRLAAIDKQKSSAQMSLFGDIIEEEAPEVKYPDIPEWSTADLLSNEKSVLGVYVSGHPFGAYSAYFSDCTFHTGMLADYEEDEETGDRTYQQFKTGDAGDDGGHRLGRAQDQHQGRNHHGVRHGGRPVRQRGMRRLPARVREDQALSAARRRGAAFGQDRHAREKLPCIILDKLTEFVPPEEQQPAERPSRAGSA